MLSVFSVLYRDLDSHNWGTYKFIDSYANKALYSKSSFKNYCIAVNQVDDDKYGKIFKVQSITSQFLDVNLHYVGCIKNGK